MIRKHFLLSVEDTTYPYNIPDKPRSMLESPMYVCCGACQYLDELRAQVMDQEPGDGQQATVVMVSKSMGVQWQVSACRYTILSN